MAAARKPGPLGLNPQAQNLNDGTLIRALSPPPGPIGRPTSSIANFHGKPSVASLSMRAPREKASRTKIQILQQGSRGPEVQKLQRQLNARLTPSPKLALDGVLGPLTHQAVLQYQQAASIAADGIVGKQTWYHLLKGDNVSIPQASVPRMQPVASAPGAVPKSMTAVQPPKIASPPANVRLFIREAEMGIWEWPMEDKFVEVLRRTAPKLPGSMRYEFEALLSPTSLGIMAGTLVVWAGSHAFGVGEVVDLVLLIGGAFFLGLAVFDVAQELADFLVVTSTAADDRDLDEAATHLARAIAIMGIAAFIALLAKVARGRGGKGSTAEAPSKPPPSTPQPAPKAARPEPLSAEAPATKPPSPGKAPSPTKVAPKMEQKILYGERVPNPNSPGGMSNELIGGHSPKIKSDPNYAVEVLKQNPDGTTKVKLTKQYPDGNLSNIKKSTLAPDSWSDAKIIETTNKVADTPSVAKRAGDGATLHRQNVGGVEWAVVKDKAGQVTSSFPTGGEPIEGFK